MDSTKAKSPISVYAGVVVTSSRSSRRRISSTEATKAFAVATSGGGPSETTAAVSVTQKIPQTARFSLDTSMNAKASLFNIAHRIDRTNSASKLLFLFL